MIKLIFLLISEPSEYVLEAVRNLLNLFRKSFETYYILKSFSVFILKTNEISFISLSHTLFCCFTISYFILFYLFSDSSKPWAPRDPAFKYNKNGVKHNKNGVKHNKNGAINITKMVLNITKMVQL